MARDRARRYETQARHREANFLRLLDYLAEHPCVDCGEPDPRVLDFDHLPGEDKRFCVGRAVCGSTRSWRAIREEITKCEVVCANCHRRRTADRGAYRKHLVALGAFVPMGPIALCRRGDGEIDQRGAP
jgi:hypothetical protein